MPSDGAEFALAIIRFRSAPAWRTRASLHHVPITRAALRSRLQPEALPSPNRPESSLRNNGGFGRSVARADDRPPEAAIGQFEADDLVVEVDRVHHLIGRIVADWENDQPVLGHVAASLAQVSLG